MIIDKNFNGLVNVGSRYEYQGDIQTTELIEIVLDMSLFVSGSIKSGRSIKSVGYIKAGRHIKACCYIESGGAIEAGGYIEAGGNYGISAGLAITAKKTISAGLKIFAGICTWRKISDSEKTITCQKLVNGTVEYGILKETGELEKKKVTLELTDEQLNKIKKIISEV